MKFYIVMIDLLHIPQLFLMNKNYFLKLNYVIHKTYSYELFNNEECCKIVLQ